MTILVTVVGNDSEHRAFCASVWVSKYKNYPATLDIGRERDLEYKISVLTHYDAVSDDSEHVELKVKLDCSLPDSINESYFDDLVEEQLIESRSGL